MSARARFRRWRRSRPWLGGLLTVVGGLVILAYPLAPLPILLRMGMTAIIGVVLGLVLVAGGLSFWLAPRQRVPVAIVTAVCSVASLVASNLGGFVIGMMAGIIGSCLAYGWAPDAERHAKSAPAR